MKLPTRLRSIVQPVLLGDLRHLVVHHVELDQRRAAHAVHEREHPIARGERQVLEDRGHQPLGDLRRRSDLLPEAPGLAVDADADLDLVLGELEARVTRGRGDARSQRHAHRASVRVDAAAELGDLLERAAVLGGATADLLDEHGHPDAAATGGVQRVLDRDVVVGEHGLDLDVLALPHVGGHVEVHDVAGVVLDDVNDAGAAVDGLRRLEHLVGRGRGEHLPRTGRVEHARPDVAAVHRLMTRAASGDEPDLALDRRVLADDDGWFVDDPYAVAVCCFNAVERVLQDRVGRIDELFHAPSLKPELIGQDARREDRPGAVRSRMLGLRCGAGTGEPGMTAATRRSAACGYFSTDNAQQAPSFWTKRSPPTSLGCDNNGNGATMSNIVRTTNWACRGGLLSDNTSARAHPIHRACSRDPASVIRALATTRGRRTRR